MNKLIKIVALLCMSVMFSGTAAASASEDAIKERVKPVGQVCVEGDDSCGSAAPAAAGGAARSGEEVFNSVCAGCHNTGAAGAPKVGDKAAWAPRIEQGIDTLLSHALNGYNAMPPKGTCANCSEEEIKGTIEYMVSKSK